MNSPQERYMNDPFREKQFDKVTMDRLSQAICDRLQAAGERGVGGRQLADELRLSGPRQLRRVIAHARVQLHRHEILGLPGDGYFWGPSNPGLSRRVREIASRMGRCHFFISSLIGREGVAMSMVQMVFDFMETSPAAGEARHDDDLAALVAAEGVTLTDFLDKFITRVAGSEEGMTALAQVGRKHANVLMPDSVLQSVLTLMDQARETLLSGAKPAA